MAQRSLDPERFLPSAARVQNGSELDSGAFDLLERFTALNLQSTAAGGVMTAEAAERCFKAQIQSLIEASETYCDHLQSGLLYDVSGNFLHRRARQVEREVALGETVKGLIGRVRDNAGL